MATETHLLRVVYEVSLLPHQKAAFFKQEQSLRSHALLHQTSEQLQQYFSGSLKEFSLPVLPQGTVFQMRAWRALQTIPYGCTFSYRDQAVVLGHGRYARAVGRANAQNPLCIIVPCHRVVASSGALSGYVGGREAKAYLLDLERTLVNSADQSISLKRQKATRPYIR